MSDPLVVRRGTPPGVPLEITEPPYKVLVAEVLLKQTPAERVEPVYVDFLEEYPTLEALTDLSYVLEYGATKTGLSSTRT